jgi:two-component system chemotaxis sensor kinase CheA
MNALHEQFVAETRELIHQATDDLIAVEREGASVERIDRIFRVFHTLKGSAGVVELPAMIVTLHAAEDLLAAIHGGQLGVTSAIIDQALACLDQVSRWVDAFEAHGTVPFEAGEQAQLHSYRDRDQRRCSSVADVAEIPASQDRDRKEIGAEGTADLADVAQKRGASSLRGIPPGSQLRTIACPLSPMLVLNGRARSTDCGLRRGVRATQIFGGAVAQAMPEIPSGLEAPNGANGSAAASL